MPDSPDTLFTQLDRRHPDYLQWQGQWELCRDVLGDEEVDKARYLPRGEFESETQYALRIQLSEFIPESPLAIQKVLGALYKQRPTREGKGNQEVLETLKENADLKGTAWDKLVEDVARNLVGYGTTRVLVNLFAPNVQPEGSAPGQPATVADERRAGVRPYVVNYSPLSVIDWDHDSQGVLSMVRIREQRWTQARDQSKSGHAKIVKFIQYDREDVQWWTFMEEDGKRTLEDQQVNNHGLGIVPMVVANYPKEIKPMIGAGYIRFASRADVQRIRADSDLNYDTYVHAHPVLLASIMGTVEKLGLGASSFLKLDPSQNEKMEYLEIPSSAFEALMKLIEKKTADIQRHTGMDPMGVMQQGGDGMGVMQASGVSRAWSFGTSEARVLSAVADAMEDIERRVLDLAVRYKSPGTLPPDKPAFMGTIQYPEDFDTAATSTLFDGAERTAQLVNSETLLRIVLKRIAASMAGDVPEEVRKKIISEIDKNPLLGTAIGKVMDPLSAPNIFGSLDPAGRPRPAAARQEPQPKRANGSPSASGAAGGRRANNP